MERGEAPGEEKKDPALSTEQKTEISRRIEESIEDDDADPNQALARGMGGCQLADATIINNSQKEDQWRSSLQTSDSSGMHGGMSAIGSAGNFAGSPARTVKKDIPMPVTPGQSHFGIHNVVCLSPDRDTSLSKRPSFDSPPTSSNQRNIRIVSPSPKKNSVVERKIDFNINQKSCLQQAQAHQIVLEDHAQQLAAKTLQIGRVFPPEDRRLADPLFAACRKLKMSAEILKTAIESPVSSSIIEQDEEGESLQQQIGLIKFKLGVLALQGALEEVNTTVKALAQHSEYGAAVREKIAALQQAPLGAGDEALLQQAWDVVPSEVIEGLSFPNMFSKTEFYEHEKKFAQNLLQQGQVLTVTTLEEKSPVALARSVFGQCDDRENLKQLGASEQEVNKKLLVLETVVKHIQNQAEDVQEEKDFDFALVALQTANADADIAMNQLKAMLEKVEDHEESWPLDVEIILEKVRQQQSEAGDLTGYK